MDFGLMFFAGSDRCDTEDRYGLLRQAAHFADRHGFCAIWTPERHFHEFGGLFPNPSVLGAALASLTTRVHIRAGSVISPLHDPIRIAEEWSVVDNLSRGRVAISFGSGWNADDFVFHPERYWGRQARMYGDIETVTHLWKGGSIVRQNGAGQPVEVSIRPRPVQAELPIWVTSSGHVDTFVSAGAIGANVLTHLIGQTLETLAGKIRRYREARGGSGRDPGAGRVTVMLHTFLGPDLEEVERIVKEPFCEYLRSAVRLEERAAAGGGAISGGRRVEPHAIGGGTLEDLTDVAFHRYFRTASLLGTHDTAREMIERLEACGVDEVACLIDFGPPEALVMASLERLDRLRRVCGEAHASAQAAALHAFTASFDS